MNSKTYCSEAAAHESMAGTADCVDVWLLLEYLPKWTARVAEDNALSHPVKSWLEQSVAALANEGLKARVQFVRQPELDRTGVRLLVHAQRQLKIVEVESHSALVNVDVPDVAHAVDRSVDETHYFVCTNGQRDLCCARFGLPTYAALRERFGARVWQTTHLGGHRFAPNVLVLPGGLLYGRVDAESVDAFANAVEAGDLARPWLRGRSERAPEAQAVECLTDGAVDINPLAEDVWQVVMGNGREVTIERAASVDVLASCGDAELKPVRSFVIRR